MKSSEVCSKTRSPPASLTIQGLPGHLAHNCNWFACDVMAAMLVDSNNKIFLLWVLTFIFMQMWANFLLFCPPTWWQCKPAIVTLPVPYQNRLWHQPYCELNYSIEWTCCFFTFVVTVSTLGFTFCWKPKKCLSGIIQWWNDLCNIKRFVYSESVVNVLLGLVWMII